MPDADQKAIGISESGANRKGQPVNVRLMDASQMMLAHHWDTALREVGVIPKDCATSGGLTLRIGARHDNPTVILDVPIVLPADKLRAALDIVDQLEGRA